jgi:hypothetical protein
MVPDAALEPSACRSRRLRNCAAAVLLSVALLPAAELGVTGIDFAPAVHSKLQGDYGEAEAATLRTAIREAVGREKECSEVPAAIGVNVTVEDLAPTRPTRKELSDNPSLDVVHSKSLGGAALKGEVLDARQHVLTTVSYRYFAPNITIGSVSRDPWADARLAIDGFAQKLAAACRESLQAHDAAG